MSWVRIPLGTQKEVARLPFFVTGGSGPTGFGVRVRVSGSGFGQIIGPLSGRAQQNPISGQIIELFHGRHCHKLSRKRPVFLDSDVREEGTAASEVRPVCNKREKSYLCETGHRNYNDHLTVENPDITPADEKDYSCSAPGFRSSSRTDTGTDSDSSAGRDTG